MIDPRVAPPLELFVHLGQAELACDDLVQAIETLESEPERALPVLVRELGPDHPRVRAATAPR